MNDRPPQDRPADKDQIKPFHARDTATGQQAADAVAAVIKHAAERDEAAKKKAPPKPQPVWMLPLGMTLAVLATFLLVAPPPWVVVNPIAAQEPEDALTDLRGAIFLYGTKIDGYRIRNGRLPQTLAEAGVAVEDLDYSVSGGNYVLSSTVGDRAVVFNSAVETLQAWAAREAGNISRDIGG